MVDPNKNKKLKEKDRGTKRKKSTSSKLLPYNDIEREQKRKIRKSLVGQDRDKSKKALTICYSSDDEEAKTSKSEKTTTNNTSTNAENYVFPEEEKILFSFPEARAIKVRIENLIKKDAAKELIKLRDINGEEKGDCEKIVRIYNAFGYKFVTKQVLYYQARRLLKTNDDKNILSRHDVDAVALGENNKDAVAGSVSVGTNKDVAITATEQASREADNITATLEAINTVKMPTEIIDQSQKKPNHGRRYLIENLSPNPPTRAKYAANHKLIQEIRTKVSERYYAERLKAKGMGVKMASGTLVEMVARAERKNDLPPGTVKLKTILSRLKGGNLTGKVPQRTPLIECIEPEVVGICVQLANMGQPLSQEQVSLVANQLIKKYNLTDIILEFKRRRKIIDEGDNLEQNSMVGKPWYKGFINRHMESIVSTCCHATLHFKLLLDDFKGMYDHVYERMVNAGIAVNYAEPSLFDIEGGVVAHTENERAYGLPSRYQVTKPEYLLYVDEVESKVKKNVSGDFDGQVFSLSIDLANTGLGSEINAFEMKFSVHCFTNGIGEVVLCAIILMSDKDVMDIPLSVRCGLDTLTPLHEGQTDTDRFERNCNRGQAMQGGPFCDYMGKEVKCFFGTSHDGKLKSQNLLEILRYLDEIELFDRNSTLRPFLLLDGHGSVFDVEFLNYVHDDMHPWVVSCGLPRDARFLYVADSNGSNATFRDEFVVAKQRLLDSRDDGKKQFFPSDIVPLVNRAWSSNYVHWKDTKRVVASRGWNPLNYSLLLHPTLQKQFLEVDKKPPTEPEI